MDGGFELDLVVADLLGLDTYDKMMKVWVTELLTKHVQTNPFLRSLATTAEQAFWSSPRE